MNFTNRTSFVVTASVIVIVILLFGIGFNLKKQDSGSLKLSQQQGDAQGTRYETDDSLGKEVSDKDLAVPAVLLGKKDVIEEFEVQILGSKQENELVTVYKTLSANVQQGLMQKTSIDTIFPNEGKQRNITIRITDGETGEGISGAVVSLRGGFLGTTNIEGELQWSRNLPRTHDYLYFQASKIGYTQAFFKKPLFFIESSDVLVEMQMKKMTKNVASVRKDPENNNASVIGEQLSITFTDDCSLRTVDGTCYEDDAMLEYQFIAPEDIDTVSIPMRALVDGVLGDLESNGMAFMNFYSNAGERLLYDGGVAEVCYILDQERIVAWQESAREGDKDGYRYFDKSDGLRKFDAGAQITISDGKFCVKTQYIY